MVAGLFGLGMLLAVFLLNGTFRAEISYNLVPSTAEGREVTFEETYTSRHWLYGLIRGEQPDGTQALSKFIRPGERVTALSVGVHHSALDLLLTGVTVGIYSPVTVTVRGRFVRTP